MTNHIKVDNREKYYFEVVHLPNTEYTKGTILEATVKDTFDGPVCSLYYVQTKNGKRCYTCISGESLSHLVTEGNLMYRKDFTPTYKLDYTDYEN